MSTMRHGFTEEIIRIINRHTENNGELLLKKCEILRYLNLKTKAANLDSKSRAGFGNLYAIYVLVEDYINGGFNAGREYKDYEGAKFSDLLRRQRELPFGSKLQNHALNHRLNQEFRKYFPSCDHNPILRNEKNNRYRINEYLMIVDVAGIEINISMVIKEIIDAYVKARKRAFSEFMEKCREIVNIQDENPEKAVDFIKRQLKPSVDARMFEIVSFAVLKHYYEDQYIYWGLSPDEIRREPLVLYKTGRTNANDGGIDFVMRPLGRFFQVTEVVDAGKYFLDIDKVHRYPITFVVKTDEPSKEIVKKIKIQAEAKYPRKAIVKRYMESVKEVINIPMLMDFFEKVLEAGKGSLVVKEIILQSQLEFNVEAEE